MTLNVAGRDRRPNFVQTDLKVHEEWGKLTGAKPRAAQLMHVLCSQMMGQDAVVISHKTLAKLMGVRSVNTVKDAISVLQKGNWIETVRLEQRGGVNAYVINSRVGWIYGRDKLKYARFSAQVIAIVDDQTDPEGLGKQPPLRRLPRIGEDQLPSGPGLPPVSQPSLTGLEPDLPATDHQTDIEDFTGRDDQ